MSKETTHERFIRLATKRTNSVLEKLRVLGNCSNSAIYSYAEEDVNKVFGAITRELNDVKAKFNKAKQPKKFSL